MKIKVLGGAREVGGSCVAVETQECKVALDYGIKLDGVTDQYPKNFDAIFISHAHLDHTGSLVRLHKSRNKQVIVGSKITRDITVDLLKDMIKIQNSKGKANYDIQAAAKVKDSWLVTDHLNLPGMTAQLHGAGHVAGAKMISLQCEDKTVLYTGDFCLHDTEILDGCTIDALPKTPDVLISESTYGGKVRPPRKELIEQFFSKVKVTLRHRGNVLIPTFAFHRTQEMAKRIDNAITQGVLPKYNVYTISNLANKVTAHFNANPHLFTKELQEQSQPFTYKHVKNLERTSEIQEPAIVICTSGFGHAGASLNLLMQWAEVDYNTIILTSGYLPPDSPMKAAKENRHFKVNGESFTLQADITQIELSGHADQTQLTKLVEKLKPKKTLLIHGDIEQAQALKQKISPLTNVHIPEKQETITI
ncbi:MAG: MBL fold metallo-hydrolase [Candidatus Bathyarchaeota archaeon]|nr:MBL fold metallo-hydrolase [Candidatus Bathyarchaeota archaeon]